MAGQDLESIATGKCLQWLEFNISDEECLNCLTNVTQNLLAGCVNEGAVCI